MPEFSTVSDVYDEARGWQWRAVRASLGTTTGLIVLAMLGRPPKAGRAVIGLATIRETGSVWGFVRMTTGRSPQLCCIGSIEAVRDSLRRLADHIKLSDADREAMFDELRKWIKKDYRARSEN